MPSNIYSQKWHLYCYRKKSTSYCIYVYL